MLFHYIIKTLLPRLGVIYNYDYDYDYYYILIVIIIGYSKSHLSALYCRGCGLLHWWWEDQVLWPPSAGETIYWLFPFFNNKIFNIYIPFPGWVLPAQPWLPPCSPSPLSLLLTSTCRWSSSTVMVELCRWKSTHVLTTSPKHLYDSRRKREGDRSVFVSSLSLLFAHSTKVGSS